MASLNLATDVRVTLREGLESVDMAASPGAASPPQEDINVGS